ncbi:MAG: ABC transporter permease [Microbacteriaceae bacterium]
MLAVGAFLGTLLLISVVTYFAIRLVGGDLAVAALGREVTQEQLESYRAANGLNDPMLLQYWNWLREFATGQWGVDPVTARPIISTVVAPMLYTFLLAFVALAISIPISMSFGVWSAWRYGRKPDRVALTASVIVVATPEFVIAIGGILLFGVWLRVLPVDSTAITIAESPTEMLAAFILPVGTLVIAMSAYFYRIARSAAYEVLESSYFEAARLRGLGTWFLIRHYVLRNAMPPLVNAIAIGAIHLIGGVVLVEMIFGYPGLGQALVQSVSGGSADVVQAIVVTLAAVFLAIGLLADLTVTSLTRPLRGG